MSSISLKQQTEGALLAVIAAVITLGTYIPVVGAFLIFVAPVPIALSAIRHGIRIGAISALLATILIFLVAGPAEAAFFFLASGSVGALIGSLIRLKLRSFTLLIVGVVLMIVLQTGTFFVGGWVMGFEDPILHMKEQMNLMMSQSKGMAEYLPMPAEARMAQSEQFDMMAKLSEPLLSMPIILFISAGCFTFVLHYHITSYVLGRIGEKIDPLPPFSDWCVPPVVLPAMLLLGMGVFSTVHVPQSAVTAGERGDITSIPILFNLMLGFQLSFFTLGMSSAVFFLNKWQVPPPLRILAYGILALPLAGLTILLGAADTMGGFRYYQLHSKTEGVDDVSSVSEVAEEKKKPK